MERIINNINIDAIPIKGLNNRKPKGHEMFDIVSSNIALIAKKKSGKSNLLYHILKNVVGRKTKFHIFCSSAYTDPVYRDMIEHFRNKGNKIDVNVGLYKSDESGGRGRRRKINVLDKLLKNLEQENKKEAQKGKGKKKRKVVNLPEQAEIRKRSPFERKITYSDLPDGHVASLLFPKLFNREDANQVEPEVSESKDEEVIGEEQEGGKLNIPSRVFIFDDLSNELNDPIIAKLLKNIRHYDEDKGGSMCIISTQYINDIPPTGRSQFDYLVCFKGHKPQKVETMRKMMDSNVDEDSFLNMYQYATKEPYSFLYCNCRDNSFRKNFNIELNPEAF